MAGTGKLAKHVGQLTWAFGKQVSELISYHRDYAHNERASPSARQLTSQPPCSQRRLEAGKAVGEAERGGARRGRDRTHTYSMVGRRPHSRQTNLQTKQTNIQTGENPKMIKSSCKTPRASDPQCTDYSRTKLYSK